LRSIVLIVVPVVGLACASTVDSAESGPSLTATSTTLTSVATSGSEEPPFTISTEPPSTAASTAVKPTSTASPTTAPTATEPNPAARCADLYADSLPVILGGFAVLEGAFGGWTMTEVLARGSENLDGVLAAMEQVPGFAEFSSERDRLGCPDLDFALGDAECDTLLGTSEASTLPAELVRDWVDLLPCP